MSDGWINGWLTLSTNTSTSSTVAGRPCGFTENCVTGEWLKHRKDEIDGEDENDFLHRDGGYSTIYSLRLRDSRGFCHITFQFSFISDLPLFQIFQILQILKWKWKWKDPTFAIFLKNMGFKDVEYNIPETLRLPRLPRLWDSETLRQKEDKTTKCKNAGPPSTIIEHC